MRRSALVLFIPLAIACGEKDADDSGSLDADGDGYAAAEDCNDDDPEIFPGATEVCDGADNDCDELIDDADDSLDGSTASTFYTDADGDDFGDADSPVQACEQPEGTVEDATDCQDDDEAIHPDADEVCNGEDDNCDSIIDLDAIDLLTWYDDDDGDGFGDPEVSEQACEAPSGYLEDGSDCDDTDDAQNPDADEVCNGEDDNCDDEVDEDSAVDASTWYTDADGDGFGDPDSTGTVACDGPSGTAADDSDCDDGDALVYPGAEELCDGADNDCDASTGEDGTVLFTDANGNRSSLSSELSGSSSSPAVYEFADAGRVTFCDGTFYVNLEAAADLSFLSFNGDPSTTILDGASSGSILLVDTDALSINVYDLTLQNGYGSGLVANYYDYDETGGAISCEASSEINLDNVVMSSNSGDIGGAIASDGCDWDIVDSEFSDNSSDFGGAGMVIDGIALLTDTEVYDNDATQWGGGFYLYSYLGDASMDLDGVLVDGNSADTGAGLVMDGSLGAGTATGSCTGTSSTSDGVVTNVNGGDEGAVLLFGEYASFSSDTCDFGTASGGDDNESTDLSYWDSTTGVSSTYMVGDDASFSCDASACGTAASATLGDSSDSVSFEYESLMIGNVGLADTEVSLGGFQFYLEVNDSACVFDYYVLGSTAFGSGAWSLLWSSTGNSVSTGTGWYGPDDVVLGIESGTYYATVFAWTGCSTVPTMYFSADGSSTGDYGFGTSQGYLYDLSYTTAYTSAPSVNVSAAVPRFYMTVDYTEF